MALCENQTIFLPPSRRLVMPVSEPDCVPQDGKSNSRVAAGPGCHSARRRPCTGCVSQPCVPTFGWIPPRIATPTETLDCSRNSTLRCSAPGGSAASSVLLIRALSSFSNGCSVPVIMSCRGRAKSRCHRVCAARSQCSCPGKWVSRYCAAAGSQKQPAHSPQSLDRA